MNIILNGQPGTIPAGMTVTAALDSWGYQDHFVAVAINRTCVPRSDFDQRKILEGDDIEILAPMAGG